MIRARAAPVSRFGLAKVLTKDDVEAIQRDREQMLTPSWLSSIPPYGEKGEGKLKADEWRVLATIYLPVTLIRLWTPQPGSTNVDPLQDQMLKMTMHLLSAVSLACGSTSTAETRDQYLEEMRSYRKCLQELFPKYNCCPNHHNALHLHECMRLFGPVHGWWAFPYERTIGLLQKAHINYQPGEYIVNRFIVLNMKRSVPFIGEYEKTIGRSFHLASRLRALFNKDACPPVIRHCADMFQTLVQPTQWCISGQNTTCTVAVNVHDEENRALPTSVRDLLRSTSHAFRNIVSACRLRCISAILINGRRFTTDEKHVGNSCVLFWDEGGNLVPGCIKHIVLASGSERHIYVVVQRHLPSLVEPDPFKAYPHLRMQLWSAEFAPECQLISVENIHAHCAKCEIPWVGRSLCVVISLARVMWKFCIFCLWF